MSQCDTVRHYIFRIHAERVIVFIYLVIIFWQASAYIIRSRKFELGQFASKIRYCESQSKTELETTTLEACKRRKRKESEQVVRAGKVKTAYDRCEVIFVRIFEIALSTLEATERQYRGSKILASQLYISWHHFSLKSFKGPRLKTTCRSLMIGRRFFRLFEVPIW